MRGSWKTVGGGTHPDVALSIGLTVSQRGPVTLVKSIRAPFSAPPGGAGSYAGDWVTRSIRRRGEPAF